MKEAFKNIRFNASTRKMIETANRIIDDLRSQGYTLTLRQLYYQCVAADIIPNKQSEYKRLGSILNDARLCGMVDWDAIEDRTRNLSGTTHRERPETIISDAAHSFRMDKWRGQDFRVEVWVEKDALEGILSKACHGLDVDFFSCRGYTSQSALYEASKRMLDYQAEGQDPVIIHLGDHDPSGIDMTRDIFDRLELMTGGPIEVKRIALNMNQVKKYNPPPNPAKQTDSRFQDYIKKHGKNCWELDALSPKVIDALIVDEVGKYRDDDKFAAREKLEAKHRATLLKISNNYEDVVKYVSSIKD